MTPERSIIYVVEDDDGFRRSLGRLLTAHKFSVELYVSAENFLEELPGNSSGCIVLDVSMPGLNGLDLQQCLAEADCSMPIVFLTGRGDIPMCARAMKQGATDFLTKPVDEKLLVATIRKALEKNILETEERNQVMDIRRRISTLTPRELEVMRHVITGELNKQIGGILGVAEKTVKVHRGRMMMKMGVQSVAELVRDCMAADVPPA